MNLLRDYANCPKYPSKLVAEVALGLGCVGMEASAEKDSQSYSSPKVYNFSAGVLKR